MIKKKLLLAHLRKGDFAHAGDIEAIELTMSKFLKRTDRLLLDVGCGLGGTAHYIQQQGWGNVTGIDINSEVIDYAKTRYPDVGFYSCDVLNCSDLFREVKFDIIYLFNALYAFKQPLQSLEVLSHLTKPGGNLVLFDYSSASLFTDPNPFAASGENSFTPFSLANLANDLNACHWVLQEKIDVSSKFRAWYAETLMLLENDKIHLIKQFGKEAFSSIYQNFSQLLHLISRNRLLGTIVYATRE